MDLLEQNPQAGCVGRWQLDVHQLVHSGSKDNHGSIRIVFGQFRSDINLILSVASGPSSI
jgi:hypothetical protein